MKKYRKLLAIIIFIIVAVFIVYRGLVSVRIIIPEHEIAQKQIVNNYKSLCYSGKITKKYIDRNDHSYEKVIINNENQNTTLRFSFEASGLYDYLRIGDSIIKKKDSLSVRVIRSHIDTTINMKFKYWGKTVDTN